MSMRVILLSSALLLFGSAAAHATNPLVDSHDVNQTNVNAPTQINTQTNIVTPTQINTQTNANIQGQDQNQGQIQGQGQHQGQAQGQSQDTDVDQRNKQTVSISHKSVRQAPDLGVLPSGPCTGSGGQGTLGAAGFAFGIGVSTVDENCSKLETVRVGLASNDPEIIDLAKRVYMSIEWVQDVSADPTPEPQVSSSSLVSYNYSPAKEQVADISNPNMAVRTGNSK